MSEWWKELRWSATANGWYARTDDILLFVPERAYQRHLAAYLRGIGLEHKPDTATMQLTEEERKKQCEARSTFQANVAYWRDIREPGIEMYSRHTNEKVTFTDPMLAEQRRQQEIACLLEYVKAGELTLREAANSVDGLMLTHVDVS